MFTLKPVSVFVALIALMVACTDSQSADVLPDKQEELPKVDQSKFLRWENSDGISIDYLKQMTINKSSGDIIFSADYLPKEYHLTVKEVPLQRFSNDADFPKKREGQLRWFASQESKKLITMSRNSEVGVMTEIRNGKRQGFVQTVHGFQYGFPLKKAIFLRCYEENNNFYSIVCWTTITQEKSFEKFAQYMGMRFEVR